MNTDQLQKILEKVKDGQITIEEGIASLKDDYYADLGCVKLDTHREMRVGYPEVIYCPGKTLDQIKTVVLASRERTLNSLPTGEEEMCFMRSERSVPTPFIIQ